MQSQPSWAAWIEIPFLLSPPLYHIGSQPSWAAWIEISIGDGCAEFALPSQPSWAAWIEMSPYCRIRQCVLVAALLGCVD